MSATIHVVFGSTGEYSDRSEWPVRAFRDAAKAEAFEFMSTKWAHELKASIDAHGVCNECYGWDDTKKTDCPRRQKPAHDPSFRIDYTGTDYYTVRVELEDE